MNKDAKGKYILNGLKFSLISSLVALVIILIIVFIYSTTKGIPFLKHANMFFYGIGTLALTLAVPQLYKKDEDPKLRRIRRMSPLFGFSSWFQSPYEEKAMIESFEENRGEGFWAGLFIVVFALFLYLYGFILERLFYVNP
jgi:hypothetical protein